MTFRLPIPILLLLLAGVASAQSQNAVPRYYFNAEYGGAMYRGERTWQGKSGWAGLPDRIGPARAMNFGYRFSDHWDLALGLLRAEYPGIRSRQAGEPFLDRNTSPRHRHSLTFEGRWQPFERGRWDAALIGGWASLRGRFNDDVRRGSGPVLGASLYRWYGMWGFGATARYQWSMPAHAADLAGEGNAPDELPSFGFGVKVQRPERKPSLDEAVISGPGVLNVGEEGVFTILTNLDPTLVQVQWDFGPAGTAAGSSLRKSFREPGSYPVEARIRTEKSALTLRSSLEVVAVIEAARITAFDVTPVAPLAMDTLWFSADITGTDARCVWDFGDGTTSARCAPWHVYREPGTYRAELTASNAAGSESAVRTIRIREDACRFFDSVADVYFRAGSDELALEMREVLRENFALAAQCPDRILVISGHAFGNERNAETLASNRAQAALQYYLNLGLASDKARLGDVIVHDARTWTGETWQGRRASTRLVRD